MTSLLFQRSFRRRAEGAPDKGDRCHGARIRRSLVQPTSALQRIRPSPNLKEIGIPGGVSGGEHVTLHLTWLMSPLPCKVECPFSAFGVQMIQHRHQLFTFCPRCIFVEEVKPGNALAEKVTRHNAGILISLTRLSDFVPTRRGGVYDVMVARWRPVLHMQTLTSSPPGFLTGITAPCKPGLAPSVTVLRRVTRSTERTLRLPAL